MWFSYQLVPPPHKTPAAVFPRYASRRSAARTPADFIEEGVHVYDQPQLGYSVRYKPTSGADAHLDVYIYPLALPKNYPLRMPRRDILCRV